MTEQPAVYILASRRNGTLYTGVTSDLLKRIWEHRSGLAEGFTKRYGVHRLVYFDIHDYLTEAIRREKQIKKWRRAWKIDLIERTNPQWHDLWPTIVGGGGMDSRLRGMTGRRTRMTESRAPGEVVALLRVQELRPAVVRGDPRTLGS